MKSATWPDMPDRPSYLKLHTLQAIRTHPLHSQHAVCVLVSRQCTKHLCPHYCSRFANGSPSSYINYHNSPVIEGYTNGDTVRI